MRQINNALKNHIEQADKPFHSWYQFVLGYPPHFVRYCISKFGITKGNLVLDPFCGTGTTNVECKRLGIDSLGLEANPMTHFASIKVYFVD
jgi:adenine-specific DNA methylase